MPTETPSKSKLRVTWNKLGSFQRFQIYSNLSLATTGSCVMSISSAHLIETLTSSMWSWRYQVQRRICIIRRYRCWSRMSEGEIRFWKYITSMIRSMTSTLAEKGWWSSSTCDWASCQRKKEITWACWNMDATCIKKRTIFSDLSSRP